MQKYVAPLAGRLRHLQRPQLFHAHRKDTKAKSLSMRLAEQVAAAIGSWLFLGALAGFLAVWIVVNALDIMGFDPPPYILLNLLLSFQAAFTGPVLLIAANAGANRDHAQYDRMEEMERTLLERHDRMAERMQQLLVEIETLKKNQPPRKEEENGNPSPAPRPAHKRVRKSE